MQIRRRLCLILPAFLSLLSACAGAVALQSRAASSPPAIDADLSDWSGMMTAVPEAPFLLGLQHDANYLYLAIESADAEFRRQLLQRGLIVWFDAEGGKEKRSGIRYPRGMMELEPGRMSGPPSERPQPGQTPIAPALSLAEQTKTLAIMGRDGGSWSMDVDDLWGLALAVSEDAGCFHYEARIPLAKGPERSYAIGVEAGEPLAFAVEIPSPPMPKPLGGEGPGEGDEAPGGMGGPPGGGRSGPPGGGMGGPPGRMGGPPGGMAGPHGDARPAEAMLIWFRVVLEVEDEAVGK